jgi:tRNA pseudouridine32 synthase/23S rRNA pseudouridine746 synthase
MQLELQKSSILQKRDTTIPILYEDDNILAICKPPHIPHHDDPQRGQLGILSLIRQQQQQPNSTFPYPHRLYGVHRLDQVTSGILLFAKDPVTANTLVTKFRQREVVKYYFAISGKRPKKKKQGWVKGRMVMGRRGSYKLLNENGDKSLTNSNCDEQMVESSDKVESNDERGGYAVTRFYTAGLGNSELACVPDRQCESKDNSTQSLAPKTAILFEPHTGKTHQIRVAAKAVGLPILGDVRYGGGQSIPPLRETIHNGQQSNLENNISVWDRTYLHASALHFQMNKGYNVTILSSPPFQHLFFPSETSVLNNGNIQTQSGVTGIFFNMMKKYCDCVPILDAMLDKKT